MRNKPVSLTSPPAGYADWLADFKGRIHTAQQRAMLAVNCDLLLPRLFSGQIDVSASDGLAFAIRE